MKLKFALDVPEEECYIGMIRRIGRTLLEHHDCAAEDVDDLEIVVGELCSNVTRHAHSETGYYQVAWEHHEDHVVVVVTDQGRGFAREEIAPMGSLRQNQDNTVRYGGYGLHLAGALTDHMEIGCVRPSGTTVRVQKHLKRRQPVTPLSPRAIEQIEAIRGSVFRRH